MKSLIRTLMLTATISSCLSSAAPSHITPDNTIIVSSIDNVLIQKNKLLRYASWMNMSDEAAFDAFINKLCAKLLSYGATNPKYAYHTSRIVNHIQQSYCMIYDTDLIYDYLKQKGYTFVFTTNKDCFSYTLTNEALTNKLNNFASAIFVSPSENIDNASQLTHCAQQIDTPDLYTGLMNKLINALPQGTIFIAPTNNSDIRYYEYLREKIDQKKNILFIDDSPKNINLFASMQTTTNTKMTSILFETPLLLVQKCVELGILSKEEDQKLIEEIEKHDKQFRQILTIVDWYFSIAASAPQISTGINGLITVYNEQQAWEHLDNANENVTSFIKQQLLKTHNLSIKGVKVMPDLGYQNMGITNEYVLMSPDTAQIITKALHNTDQNTLDQWRGVLEHEGNHVKNNDPTFINIARILSPFITRGSITLLAMMGAYIFKHEKRNTYKPHEYEKILTKSMLLGYLNSILSRIAWFSFSRYTEQRADDQISDNITILKAIKKFFEKLQEPKQYQSSGKTCYDWFHNFFETHPLLTTRIEKLAKRIALLEQTKT